MPAYSPRHASLPPNFRGLSLFPGLEPPRPPTSIEDYKEVSDALVSRKSASLSASSRQVTLPEDFTLSRQQPFPEVLDRTLAHVIFSLPRPPSASMLLSGAVFPEDIPAELPASLTLVSPHPLEQMFFKKAHPRARFRKSIPRGKEKNPFDLAVYVHDSPSPAMVEDRLLELSGLVKSSGLVVLVIPAPSLLDYKTEPSTSAQSLRETVHQKMKTHFILRPTAPLMEPAWDILVMSPRLSTTSAPVHRWRKTGSGVLPWQNCNEAISSSPWLLVESEDQVRTAVARCVSYPWERLPTTND